jgi:hypothetical protein
MSILIRRQTPPVTFQKDSASTVYFDSLRFSCNSKSVNKPNFSAGPEQDCRGHACRVTMEQGCVRARSAGATCTRSRPHKETQRLECGSLLRSTVANRQTRAHRFTCSTTQVALAPPPTSTTHKSASCQQDRPRWPPLHPPPRVPLAVCVFCMRWLTLLCTSILRCHNFTWRRCAILRLHPPSTCTNPLLAQYARAPPPPPPLPPSHKLISCPMSHIIYILVQPLFCPCSPSLLIHRHHVNCTSEGTCQCLWCSSASAPRPC